MNVKDLRLSDEGYKVLHEREGLKLKAYPDTKGIWTIGLGHTSAAGPPQVLRGMTITADEAEEIFRRDCQMFREEVAGAVKVELEQHQFDALASFIYNVGASAFRKSTALKRLNAMDYDGCAQALLMFNKPSEIMSRRRGEHEQFLGKRCVARIDAKGAAV